MNEIEYKNSNFMSIRCIQFNPWNANIFAYGTMSTGDISIIKINDKKV